MGGLRYYITDRKALPAGALIARIAAAAAADVDYIQIREKDLTGAELYELARAARERVPGPTKLLVNERADIALAAGFDGVHLPSAAISPERIRQIAPSDFLIGVSCHSLGEVQAAGDEADFVVFGPVFETASKRIYGPPKGLEALREVCSRTQVPVLALGGVTPGNQAACIEAGASGVAGIGMFQSELR